MPFHRSSLVNWGVFLGAAWCHPECLPFTDRNSGPQKIRSRISLQSVETLCIMLQTELGHPACLSGSVKCLIIPLGWVVNENSNTSSLFHIGDMGDAIRYLCSNSVYLEGCKKPCFFKHKRNQKEKKKLISLPFTPNVLWSTPQLKTDASILPKPHNYQTLFKLSSASGSSVIPSTP